MSFQITIENVRSLSRNHCYNFTKNGTYLKPEGKTLKAILTWEMIAHKRKQSFLVITNPCKVSIIHHRKTKRDVDVMNLEKLICDAMTDAGIYKDDKLIYEFYTKKIIDASTDKIEILVEEIPSS